MELGRELSTEQLPHYGRSDSSIVDRVVSEHGDLSDRIDSLSDEELIEKVEIILSERIQKGDYSALFLMGQFYFEQKEFEKAKPYFERAKDKGDLQAVFQLGVMYYDGLGCTANHKLGVENMRQIAQSTSRYAHHLQRAAHYNLARAYFQGFGVKRSDEEAERWLLLAADDGNPSASLKAQTALGLYFSLEDCRDLKKAFFWHSEACGNGSLESQGALGVMYMNGLGTRKDTESAFICLREASERGNVFAMGNLISYYYQRKLYTKTVELAARVAQLTDVQQIAEDTDCLPRYIAKGIALATFYYARCLHMGHGVKKNEEEAKKFYSKSYRFDPDVCANLQNITQHGGI